MERTQRILMFYFLLMLPGQVMADVKSTMYKAYINNDMKEWKETIDSLQAQKSTSGAFLIDLINFQYGYIGWCMSNRQKEEAGKYLELAEANLKILEGQSYRVSYINAYKSAFYGFRVSLNAIKAPLLGPKSIRSAELAMKQDSTNPFGYIQYANAQYYMPAAFGGSKTLAISYFQKAEIVMQQNPSAVRQDWNYLSLLVMIGQAYTETGNYQAARQYYEKILNFEPDFQLVKNGLYPNLLKRIK